MRTLAELREAYPLTAITCLTEDGMSRIASDIETRFARDCHEDGLEYNEIHGSLEVIAKLHVDWHVENGGDHYCGIWEQISVIDRKRIDVELYDEDGERCIEAEKKLEKLLN